MIALQVIYYDAVYDEIILILCHEGMVNHMEWHNKRFLVLEINFVVEEY